MISATGTVLNHTPPSATTETASLLSSLADDAELDVQAPVRQPDPAEQTILDNPAVLSDRELAELGHVLERYLAVAEIMRASGNLLEIDLIRSSPTTPAEQYALSLALGMADGGR